MKGRLLMSMMTGETHAADQQALLNEKQTLSMS
jgi:hypothetical protein